MPLVAYLSARMLLWRMGEGKEGEGGKAGAGRHGAAHEVERLADAPGVGVHSGAAFYPGHGRPGCWSGGDMEMLFYKVLLGDCTSLCSEGRRL